MLLLYFHCHMQDLVDSLSIEVEVGGDLEEKDVYLTNGNLKKPLLGASNHV